MNNKFNTVLSFLLALIIILTSSVAFCESEALGTQTTDEAVLEDKTEVLGLYEMNFLNSLGIVNFTEAKLTQSVTNEEFAGAAGLIGGIVSDYYQSGALDMLVDCAYLPSSCAYPDRTINYMQAVKGMVSVLGYDAPAKQYGGYPDGYIIQASHLNITDGLKNIDNQADLTYGMLCVMMYNALDVKILVQSSYGQNGTYEKGETVLNGVFDVYEAYGRVSANSITSLNGDNIYNPGRIEIDGVDFVNTNSSYDDYFGYNVKYYYTEEANSYKVLYMEIEEGSNKILVVDENDGTFVEDKNIYYYTQKGTLKSASVSDGYCLVYNKRVTDKGLENYEGNINGHVKMADTDYDGKYDFIEINAYDTIYVSRINSYDSEIFDKYNVAKSASFDEKISDSKFIIRDVNGNDIAFSTIKTGNVVSVLMSEDKEVATAILSTDAINLVVEEIEYTAASEVAYIYSGGEKYPVSESLINYLGDIKLGQEYKLARDFSGYIAGFEKADEVYEAGLIVSVIRDNDKGKDPVPQIRIFGTDGSFKTFDFDEKVEVDGKLWKEYQESYDALYKTVDGKRVYKSKFIRYRVKEDKITAIDTAYYNKGVESENSLQIVGSESNKTISRDGQCFGASDGTGVVYDAALTVFLAYRTDLPEDDESEYSIITPTDLPNGYSIPNVTGYATSAKTPDTQFIVIGLTNEFATQMQVNNYIALMFDRVTMRTDENGEEKYCIYAHDLLKNAKFERLVDDITKLDGIKKGDIFSIRFTFGGAIGSVFKSYDAKTNKTLFTDECSLAGATASGGTSPKWLHGKAYSAGSSYVYVLPESKAGLIDKATLADCKMVAVKRRQPNYYIYDTAALSKDQDILTPVAKDSVNDYLNTGVGVDTVLVSSYPSEYSAVIIFR